MEYELRVAIIQSDIIWEDANQNRINFSSKINAIQEDVDIIVLQEMFTTGFTNNVTGVSETMEGKSIKWMLRKSVEMNSLLIGSLIIKEKGKYYNRLIITFPNGDLKYYDKRHLFSYAGEDKVFSSGKVKLYFDFKGFKICPLICYDLRFPVWARNTMDFDLLIYIANWPKPRIMAWEILLKARAIENLSYVIGTNRVGKDKKGLEYTGHSSVLDAFGDSILEFDEMEEATKTVVLKKSHIIETRNKLGFLKDGDRFKILTLNKN